MCRAPRSLINFTQSGTFQTCLIDHRALPKTNKQNLTNVAKIHLGKRSYRKQGVMISSRLNFGELLVELGVWSLERTLTKSWKRTGISLL